MAFTLAPLPYAHNALEPYIDARTMEIHHGKHHQAYVTNLNNAIKDSDWDKMSIEQILGSISKASPAIRNNGGGHYNHDLFWSILCPHGAHEYDRSLPVVQAIESELGGYEKFKTDLTQAGVTRFGSGWAWLYVKADGKLAICSTPNQDNPLMDIAENKGRPILGIDVWEHAYYLHYQNRRPDYLNAIFLIFNWQRINELYLAARK